MTLSRLLLLPFAVGILTGCTSLVTSYNRIYSMMTQDDTPDEVHHYGAYFSSSTSLTPGLPSQWSGSNLRQDPKALPRRGCRIQPRVSTLGNIQ